MTTCWLPTETGSPTAPKRSPPTCAQQVSTDQSTVRRCSIGWPLDSMTSHPAQAAPGGCGNASLPVRQFPRLLRRRRLRLISLVKWSHVSSVTRPASRADGNDDDDGRSRKDRTTAAKAFARRRHIRRRFRCLIRQVALRLTETTHRTCIS